MNDNDTPHIAVQCSDCGFVFDLKFGTDCPACHHVGVKWAQLVTEEEAQQRGAYAQQRLRSRLMQWEQEEALRKAMKDLYTYTQYSVETGLPLSLDECNSIAECEAIFALEDNR